MMQQSALPTSRKCACNSALQIAGNKASNKNKNMIFLIKAPLFFFILPHFHFFAIKNEPLIGGPCPDAD
jgi:hypothetical protein